MYRFAAITFGFSPIMTTLKVDAMAGCCSTVVEHLPHHPKVRVYSQPLPLKLEGGNSK